MPEVFGIDGRRGFGRETGQILADGPVADIGVGVEKGLERNWVAIFPARIRLLQISNISRWIGSKK